MSRLCKGERWRMSIPASQDRDHDLILGDALRAGREAVDLAAKLEMELAKARQQAVRRGDVFAIAPVGRRMQFLVTEPCPDCGRPCDCVCRPYRGDS